MMKVDSHTTDAVNYNPLINLQIPSLTDVMKASPVGNFGRSDILSKKPASDAAFRTSIIFNKGQKLPLGVPLGNLITSKPKF